MQNLKGRKRPLFLSLFLLIVVFVYFGFKKDVSPPTLSPSPPSKILILVIGGGNGNAYDFYREWWMRISDQVRPYGMHVYIIRYSINALGPMLVNENTILLPGQDSVIPGILKCTIESLEMIRTQRIPGHDAPIMMRTNLSTFWKLFMLIPWIQRSDMQSRMLYAGLKYHIQLEEFVPGGYLFLSKHTWHLLLDNHTTLDYSVIEDIAIGRWMRERDIPITYNLEVCIVEDTTRAAQVEEQRICQDMFVFRIKTGNTLVDLHLWHTLYNGYYRQSKNN